MIVDAILKSLDDSHLAELARRLLPHLEPHLRRDSEWLSSDEAAEVLRCRRARVHDLIEAGKLACVRDGRRILIARDELDRYLGGQS